PSRSGSGADEGAVSEPPARDPRLIDVQLVESTRIRRSAEAEHERRVAIFDLIEANSFAPAIDHSGPYRLLLSAEETRLFFDVRDAGGGELARFPLALQPFRGIVKDYFKVCESYYQAIKTATPARIEAIDMG